MLKVFFHFLTFFSIHVEFVNACIFIKFNLTSVKEKGVCFSVMISVIVIGVVDVCEFVDIFFFSLN